MEVYQGPSSKETGCPSIQGSILEIGPQAQIPFAMISVAFLLFV